MGGAIPPSHMPMQTIILTSYMTVWDYVLAENTTIENAGMDIVSTGTPGKPI